MKRLTCLPLRTVAAALLASITATVSVRAQHPTLTAPPQETLQPGDPVDFVLGEPTGGKYSMLVCYVDLIGEVGTLSDLIKKSVGAVASYASPPTSSANPFVIPGVDTSINGVPHAGVPLGHVYTVPPEVIANAISEIDWSNYEPYLKPFNGQMAWDSNDMPLASNAMPWSSLGAGSSTSLFDVNLLVRACLARQIGYFLDLAPSDTTVQTQVDAVVTTASVENQSFALNAVVVELQDFSPGGPTPTTPHIKLSRKVRITLQIPGAGTGRTSAFHWNGVFPVYPLSTLRVPLFGLPVAGIYALFLPTASGFEPASATLHTQFNAATNEVDAWLEATVPAGIITGDFAAWNVTTSEYLQLGDNGALSRWTYYAPHPTSYVPLPLIQ